MPTQIASRTITPELTGGVVGNLWLRKATTGRTVPVKAKTLRKKNNHWGMTVGKVKFSKAYKPPQPIIAKMMAAGMKELTGGEDFEFIVYPQLYLKKIPGIYQVDFGRHQGKIGGMLFYASRNSPSTTSPSFSS